MLALWSLARARPAAGVLRADRERRHAALYADPVWLAYRERVGETGWVQHQTNRILKALELPRA